MPRSVGISILLFITQKNRVEKIAFQRGFSFPVLFFRCPVVQVCEVFPEDAQDESCGEEENPGHVGRSQGQGFHESGQGSDGQARCFEAVVQGRDKGEDGGQDVDLPAAVEEVVEEGEENEADSQRVEEEEHRNGAFDDGGKTEEGDAKGQDGEDGGPGLVGEPGHQQVEVGGAGGGEADGRGEACQDHDDYI